MLRRFSTNFALFSIALDLTLVALALWISNSLRPYLNDLPFAEEILRPQALPFLLYFIFPVIYVAILMLFSVYDGRRNLLAVNEIARLIFGSLLAGVALAGALYLSFREISRLLFIVFGSLAFSFTLSWRLLLRLTYWRSAGRQIHQRKVLIIGAGPVGRNLQKQIEKNNSFGLQVVGFLDDDSKKRLSQRDILGATNQARPLLIEMDVDDVVIALPPRAYERVNSLVAELHDLPVKVWVIPDYFHQALHQAVAEEFAGIPMLDLRAPALDDTQRLTKRAFDLFLSILALPFFALILLVIGAAIRLDTPGPVLFQQKRVGENGRIFKMFKFRTMVQNAESLRHLVEEYDSSGNLIHKKPDDPRVTRVGRFLRRYSIDEVPNLLNVIKGEMSLVGPRPELPYLVERYKPWQRKRFAVPQGMTGWWQVNGRSDKPMHLHSEDDLYYVQNYSLWLDIQILLKTILVVLRGKGAF